MAYDNGTLFMIGNSKTDKFKQQAYKIKEQLVAIKTKLNNKL